MILRTGGNYSEKDFGMAAALIRVLDASRCNMDLHWNSMTFLFRYPRQYLVSFLDEVIFVYMAKRYGQ